MPHGLMFFVVRSVGCALMSNPCVILWCTAAKYGTEASWKNNGGVFKRE